MTATKPNVVFVVADQLKASALPCYGNSVVRTPNLDAFAEASAVFERAFTPYPLCVPARAAMFSGQYPRNLGSRDNSVLLPTGTPHLVSALAEAGYRTGLSGKNHCFRDQDARLFDFWYEAGHHGPPDASDESQKFLRTPSFSAPYGAGANPFPMSECTTSLLTDAAINFLRTGTGSQPLFLWLSYPDPHPPYQAPRAFADRCSPESVELPVSFREDLSSKPRRQQIARRMFGMEQATEQGIRVVTSIYYAMIEYLDHEIGRLFKHLERSGLLGNTIVIFTSDHGEYMGEHGLVRKSNAFYDCLVRVPLFVRAPGVQPIRSAALVELTDLAPTIVELLDLGDMPSGRQLADAADGMSFAALVSDPAGGAKRSFVLAEAGTEGNSPGWDDLTGVPAGPLDDRHAPWGARPEAWRGRGIMLRTDGFKYVHYLDGDLDELYDLDADPHEIRNLCGEPAYARRAARMREQLLDCLLLTERRSPALRGGSGAACAAGREEMALVHKKVAESLGADEPSMRTGPTTGGTTPCPGSALHA